MKKTLHLAMALFMMSQLSWAQFYIKLSKTQRKELAEAYYLVGRQYDRVSLPGKGRAFRQMAFKIDPDLNPEAIQLRELPSAEALMRARGTRMLTPPPERPEAEANLIRSHFLRFIVALLAEDADSMLAMMSGSVYITPLRRELSREQIRDGLERFFATTSLSGLVPSQVYDFNSLKIKALSNVPQSWGPSYSLEIRAATDFSEYISFWREEQRFLVHRVDGRWLIFAYGLPPQQWSPQIVVPEDRGSEALGPTTPQGTVTGAIGGGPAGPEIKQVFLNCIEAFLRKDITEAASFFAQEILILRLDKSISRQELAITFEGYAENRDFSQVKVEDLLDPESVFVEKTERFAERSAGEAAGSITAPAYLLNVKTSLDLSELIPFWTRFQQYYFSLVEEGGWKIFAIF